MGVAPMLRSSALKKAGVEGCRARVIFGHFFSIRVRREAENKGRQRTMGRKVSKQQERGRKG